MRKTSRAENRFYLILALLMAFGTFGEVSFLEGRIAGATNQKNAHDQLLEREESRGDYWKGRYMVLSHEADAVDVLSAEIKFQQQARAGQ